MSRDIPINLIDRDEAQPRQHFDQTALAELAQSIAANGLAVPILVRPAGERFVIVHGERRYRAVRSIGHETIAADVRDLSDDEAHWLALVENVQRADLSPIEEARAYRARLDEGLTQEALGQRIGKSQSYIATKLRFLKLSDEVQEALTAGAITEGHAKQLLRVDDLALRQSVFELARDARLPIKRMAEIIDHALQEHPDFAAIVTTINERNALIRQREFGVWADAMAQGRDAYLQQAKAILSDPGASIQDLLWSTRTAHQQANRAGEVNVRCEYELGRLIVDIKESHRDLGVQIIGIASALREVQAGVTPGQFQIWARAELHMDVATAHDFMRQAPGNPATAAEQMTDRMWGWLADQWSATSGESMSRDIVEPAS
jgi:ParB/RepB/Spo0J family partition protein